MATLFQKARDWLPQKTQAAAGESITYTRGATSLTLTAVLGRTVFAVNTEDAAKIQFGDGDFLILVEDLAALGPPRVGDRIELTLSGETAKFEVQDPSSGEHCWRFSDPQQQQYRVHCKWKKPT
jgi:hypothetical protein